MLADKAQRAAMSFDDGLGDEKSDGVSPHETAPLSLAGSAQGLNCIQFQIQFQHIHSRLAQKS